MTRTEIKELAQQYIYARVLDSRTTTMESRDPDYMTPEFQSALEKQIDRVRRLFRYDP